MADRARQEPARRGSVAGLDELQPVFAEPIPTGDVADRSIRLCLAVREIVAEEGWEFYTIQSFPGLADYYSATCFAQSMRLNDRVSCAGRQIRESIVHIRLVVDDGIRDGDFF